MSLVQSFVPRPESVRAHLAQLTWKKGTDAFFTQKIPFAGRNGPAFAEKIAKAIAAVAAQVEDAQYHVYDLGAGMGLLSRFALDALAKDYPGVYAKLVWHLVEGSQAMVDQWAQSPQFADHREKLRFEIANVMDPDWQLPEPALFCLSSYLWDALPTRHVVVRQGRFFEIVVQTEWIAEPVVVDVSRPEPKPIPMDELVALLADFSNPKTQLLAPQLAAVIQETYTEVPVETASHWTQQQRDSLKNSLASHPEWEGCTVNVIPELDTHLASVWAGLHPKGVYCVSDFGWVSVAPCPVKQLMTTYGMAQFHGVQFQLATDRVLEWGGQCWHTLRKPGTTQEWLMAKDQASIEAVSPLFELSTDPISDRIGDALDELNALSPEDPGYLDKIDQLCEPLSQHDRQDHFFLKNLGVTLFQAGYLDQALAVAEQLLDVYKECAVWGFLIAGWVYQKQNELSMASQCFQTVIMVCPTLSVGYLSLGMVVLNRSKPEALSLFRKALIYSAPEDINTCLSIIETVSAQT
ncbi:MAG: SAM-dependent methyltransferase [Candidatus Margulisiibacteriota bacterium]